MGDPAPHLRSASQTRGSDRKGNDDYLTVGLPFPFSLYSLLQASFYYPTWKRFFDCNHNYYEVVGDVAGQFATRFLLRVVQNEYRSKILKRPEWFHNLA